MSFSSLNLCAALLRAISESNYSIPTPIQAATIPAILNGADVWARAPTGSGKTAAFALPLLQRLSENTPKLALGVRALILVPTRELAMQIGEAIRQYARYLPVPIKTLTVFGGVSINPQMMALRGGADIVVATPGRLLDLVDRSALRLEFVEALVLDEADRLFDLGFAAELERALRLLPPQRQNLLFSATFPAEVHALAESLLKNPVRAEVASALAEPSIVHRSIKVDADRRTQLLRHLIQGHRWSRVLVFVATKYATEHVAQKLGRAGIAAAALHGELAQGARAKALADLKAEKLQVLIATDVAARGIDIERLPVVVNYDLPRSAVDYVHRVGRTARAGETGLAVSFVDAASEAHFRLIEKRHGIRLERESIEGFEPVATAERSSASGGGIKGHRKSKKDKLRAAAAQGQAAPSYEPTPMPADSVWKRRR